MKVIVTAAGQSKRFFDAGYPLPKFMLPVFNSTMIERVLKMFDYEDDFLIVTTTRLFFEFHVFFESLEDTFRNLEVVTVSEHKLGPVNTLMNEEVRQWVGPDDFVVSYCDFFLNWNYSLFLEHIRSSSPEGCIVSFKGMQPSSRGSTMFAYLRTKEQKVLEVREKTCFTDNRIEEHASAGVYYFKSYQIFEKGVRNTSSYFEKFEEQYVSLVYNGILNMGLNVSHFEVEQFVCLGTPKDYEEFLFWNTYFDSININIDGYKFADNKLIPMAGFGQRFRNLGILVPKPFIPLRNRAMFIHAVEAFPQAEKSFVVVLEDHVDRVERAIVSTSSQVQVVALQKRTSGPGHTVLQSLAAIPSEEDLIVMSCDYDLRGDTKSFEDAIADTETKVVLFYTHYSEFRMNNPKAFAYCETNEEGLVRRIIEKDLLSENPSEDKLLVGSFWFRNSEYLRIALENARSNGRYINGELYIANSLNELLELGIRIRAVPVTHWISFGDPEEFEIYVWWETLFNSLLAEI